jgi:hypothetical protein
MTDKANKSDRTYLTEEEVQVLEQRLTEWNDKADKKSREAFVIGEILPLIQQLNMEKFGPEMLEKDKAAKILWEKRIKVSGLDI